MAAVASIQFTQGANVGVAGQALLGDLTSGGVTVSNGSNTSVASWQIDILYAPPGSSVPVSTPYVFNNSSSTPSATFTPDLTGSYRVQLTVWESTNRAGVSNQDIRVFAVPEGTHQLVRPPVQIWPKPLPPVESGLPGAKANEMNFGGQPGGWVGGTGDGLLDDLIRRLDASSFDVLPFPASGNDRDIPQVVNINLDRAICVEYAAGSYWASSNTVADLVEIDATQFAIQSHTDGLVNVPNAALWVDLKTLDGTTIWLLEVTAGLDGLLRSFDASTKTFSEAVPIAASMSIRPEIVFDTGSSLIWTYNLGTIYRVDNPRTGAVTTVTPSGSGFPKSITYDGSVSGKIWVASHSNDDLSIVVDRVDPTTAAVDATFNVTTPFGANTIENLTIAAGATAIWIMAGCSATGQTFLYKVDPLTATQIGSTLNLSSTFTYMGLDIATNQTDGDKVYVLGNSGVTGQFSKLAKINGASNTITTVLDLDTLVVEGGFLNCRLNSLNNYLVIPYNAQQTPLGDGTVFFVDATAMTLDFAPNPVVSEVIYRASREGSLSPVPVSAIQGGYGFYNIVPTDYLVPVDASGSAFEVILPPSPVGTRFEIVDALGFATFNAITVSVTGSDTILGLAHFIISTNYGHYTFTKVTRTAWSVS